MSCNAFLRQSISIYWAKGGACHQCWIALLQSSITVESWWYDDGWYEFLKFRCQSASCIMCRILDVPNTLEPAPLWIVWTDDMTALSIPKLLPTHLWCHSRLSCGMHHELSITDVAGGLQWAACASPMLWTPAVSSGTAGNKSHWLKISLLKCISCVSVYGSCWF